MAMVQPEHSYPSIDHTTLIWRQSLAIGHPKIDAQHRGLVDLIVEFAEAVEDGVGIADLIALLDECADYAAEHFATEEALMQGTGYPDVASHMEEHREFIHDVANQRQRVFEADPTVHARAVLDWLRLWLSTHVLVSDQRLAPWLEQEDI